MRFHWLSPSLALLAGCATTWGTVHEPAAVSPGPLPLVNVWLNGEGPFAFVIDTGADGCVVSESVAARLQIPIGREGMLRGGGGSVEAHRLLIRSVEVAGARAENVRFTMAELPNGSPDGLLGNELLKAYRVSLDFPHSQVRLDR